MTRVLVVGGSGMLGREVVKRLERDQVAFAAPSSSNLDVTSEDAVMAAVEDAGFTHLVNAAAFTAVDRAEEEGEAAEALNAVAPGLLARAAMGCGAHLVHVSTDYVFNGQAAAPYAEDAPCDPLGVYGATKRRGEEAVLAVAPTRSTVVRTSWLFGAHGGNFVKTMLRLMKERKELRVVADQRGRPTAAGDLAEAILQLAGLGDSAAVAGIFHFANAGATSWHGFAEGILAEARRQRMTLACERIAPITTEDYPTPAARPAYSVLSTAGFEARFPGPRGWEAALADVIKALRDSEA